MDKATARKLFLEFTTKSTFEQSHFLSEKEKELQVSPAVLYQYLMDALKHYREKLNKALSRMQTGNGRGANVNPVNDAGLPLLIESGGLIEGYLRLSELPYYAERLDDYFNRKAIVIISNGHKCTYDFDQSAIPASVAHDFQKWFEIRPGVTLTDAALQKWVEQYRFFLDSRPDLRPLLLSKGIELAEIYLRHCREYEPNDHLQIDSIKRRIDAAGKMAAGVKEEKKTNPKTTKRTTKQLTSIAIALIHVFTKEPISPQNKNEIAKRYKKPDGNYYSADRLYNDFLSVADSKDRKRGEATDTRINNYLRCINWLKSKGRGPAAKAATAELQEMRDKPKRD